MKMVEIKRAELVDVDYVKDTDYLGVFKFKPHDPIKFRPGQFVTLGISRPDLEELAKEAGEKTFRGTDIVIREYSVASPPEESQTIELYIIRVDAPNGTRKDGKGLLTTELFNPQDGIKYWLLDSAGGGFLLPEHELRNPDPNDKRTRIMVATGTGIAPYMSMLRSPTTQTTGRKFVLIHGVRYTPDHAYKKEIEAIQNMGIDLVYIPIASKDTTPYNQKYVQEFFFRRERLKTGRVEDEEVEQIKQEQLHGTDIEQVIGHELRPENDIIMACGGPDMIKSLEKIAKALGFKARADFKKEDYWKLKT
ncbi:MAG: hypothetical protein AABX74_03960 [Nanoarchaeota archaeon]